MWGKNKSFKYKVLAPIMVIFILTLLVISFINYNLLYSTVQAKTNVNLETFNNGILAQLKHLQLVLETTERTIDLKNADIANSIAYTLQNTQTDFSSERFSSERLWKLAEILDIVEINIFDSDEMLVQSNIPENVGLHYNTLNLETSHDLTHDSAHTDLVHYAKAALPDGGFVVLGFNSSDFDNLHDEVNIETAIKESKTGSEGYGMIITDGVITAHPQQQMIGRDVWAKPWYNIIKHGDGFSWIDIDDVKYYAGYKNDGLQTVVGLVSETDYYRELKQVFTNTLLLIFAAFIIITTAVYLILGKVVSPIERLSETLTEVAGGRLDVAILVDSDDEIGRLAYNLAVVVEHFDSMVKDINTMSYVLLKDGDIDYQIDAAQYKGDYRKAIDGINGMMAASCGEMLEINAAYTKLSEGDFSTFLRQFPGKKAIANKTFDTVKQKLKDIYNEIDSLITDSAKGRLDTRVETSRYSGGWSELLTGLNNLLDAVISPMNETSDVLHKIEEGDFNARVQGDYKGQFAAVKNTVNAMASSIESHMNESRTTLNILENILNSMDAYIYVSNPVTDEIMFINDNMKKHFDLEGDGCGQICWQVLQSGHTERCDFCPCYKLDDNPDVPVVWEENNTITHRYYRNTDRYIDWPDGKKVHLQHSVDITDIKQYINDKLQAERSAHESELAKGRAEAAREAIISSLTYASKIQKNLLPKPDVFERAFLDHSIIWSPRDIVGGDVYWIKNFENGTVLCVCDCTGHGTPGALLTMLVVSTFESYVNESNYTDTARIIWMLEKRLVSFFGTKQKYRNKNGSRDLHDGCDLAVLYIANDGSVDVSAGQTHVFVCDGNQAKQHKGQRLFIGEGKIKSCDEIRTVKIPANPDNKFYIASDGLFDQVGGKSNIPFGYERFKKIILENHVQNQNDISGKVWEQFESYRNNMARRDDVQLITFKPKM